MDRYSTALARALLLTVVTALAGCAQGNSEADLQPSATQAAPAAAAAPQPAAAAPPVRQAAMTPEKIKAECWMKYEGDKKIKNIDERLKLVEKCIDETSRGQPPQR
jgi:hypothetical protein